MEGLAEVLALDETAWAESALCAQADPEAWFPERGQPAAEAKAICRSCRARWDCLESALLRNERHGVWGALGVEEREVVRRGGWPRLIDDVEPHSREETEHVNEPVVRPVPEVRCEPEQPRVITSAPLYRHSYSTTWPQPGDPLLSNPIVGDRPAA